MFCSFFSQPLKYIHLQNNEVNMNLNKCILKLDVAVYDYMKIVR